jgi:hypothetical protein
VPLSDKRDTHEVNDPRRQYTALVWVAVGGQERVSIVAGSWDEAVVLIKERYGADCEFHLTDVEAANRLR